ncbi:MAG: hypothetical protein OEY97_12385 [Nitrospirota bacterium]|nr:hypothetical protein [Nitrospirota bacterium]
MHTIDVDDDVFAHIEANASGFAATPNGVLRRLLGLDGNGAGSGCSDRVRPGSPGRMGAGGSNGWGPPAPNRRGWPGGAGRPGGQGGPPRPRMRQPRANLSALVEAGILKEGQKLFLKDLKGEPVPEVAAEVRDGQVWFGGRNWAMSKLAGRELGRRGYESPAFRGPSLWYTEDGRSIRELWEEWLSTRAAATEAVEAD